MNAQVQTETAPVITVTHILDRYERDCLDELAERTRIDYRRHLGHLRRRFGHLDASQLEPRLFSEYLNAVKRGRINRVRELAVLSAAFTIAVRRWFWIKVNVLRDVERPRSKPRDRLVLDEEFAACKAMAPKRVQLAMQLALLTGQRQGDIIRFRWSDIRDDSLHLQQSKTKKRLAIEISPDLEAVLDECWRLKGSGSTGGAYILPTRTGKEYTSAGFRALWQKTMNAYCRRGGTRYRFHDLRAMAATKCPTVEIAQQLLGHSSSNITRAIYRRGVERVKPLQLSTTTNLIEGSRL